MAIKSKAGILQALESELDYRAHQLGVARAAREGRDDDVKCEENAVYTIRHIMYLIGYPDDKTAEIVNSGAARGKTDYAKSSE